MPAVGDRQSEQGIFNPVRCQSGMLSKAPHTVPPLQLVGECERKTPFKLRSIVSFLVVSNGYTLSITKEAGQLPLGEVFQVPLREQGP